MEDHDARMIAAIWGDDGTVNLGAPGVLETPTYQRFIRSGWLIKDPEGDDNGYVLTPQALAQLGQFLIGHL